MKRLLILLSFISTLAYAQENKPKNIIFMVGDGMGPAQVYAGMIVNGNKLNLERVKVCGFHKSYSSDNIITDSAAGATAFSTGNKTYNGAVGVNKDTVPQETILETAEKKGFNSSIVVTCSMGHATPASFYSHVPKRKAFEDIATYFVTSEVDFAVGGGMKYYAERKDGRNLIEELEKQGYTVYDNSEDVAKVDQLRSVVFIAEEEPDSALGARGDVLVRSTDKAIELLSADEKPFFMLVEGSQIDWGGHANSTSYITSEVIDFDKAVGAALDFAEKDGNTLVIITADHETGGFAINGGSVEEKRVETAFTTTHHTGVMIPVYAFGPGAEEFGGIYENTAIYEKMMMLLGLK